MSEKGPPVRLLKLGKRLFRSKRQSSPRPTLTSEQRAQCANYFDLNHYREVSETPSFTEASGLQHYLDDGWREGLDPSMAFSTKGYLDLYPDVAAEDMNPLVHFILHGQFEHRHIQRVNGGFSGKIEDLSLTGIKGWAINERNRDMIVKIKVMIDEKLYATVECDQARPDLKAHGISNGAGGFQIAIPFGLLDPSTYEVVLEFPDGSQISQSQTFERSPYLARSPIPASLPIKRAYDLKIVVPIFNAIEDVRMCLERLRAFTPPGVEVILIDDGSDDPAIAEELGGLAGDEMFRVLRNKENMGFTKTVNRGIDEAGTADVIILNSDARVTPGWAEGLDAAAKSHPRVATVTPMSDRAGAFSAPNIGNENYLPTGVREQDFAIAFRRRSLRLYPEVPTGNGFCMLIRRVAINELGALDAVAFPRGYGEENDFCMRALRAGWSNIIDDATYVFHERSKSFGEEKAQLMSEGRAVVDRRYPEYKKLTSVYQTGGRVLMARYRARLALADCTNEKEILPRALFVLATRTGGTPQTNMDLMTALAETFECYVLVCDSTTIELSLFEEGKSRVLKKHQLYEPIEPLSHVSNEYDQVVAEWMGALDLSVVHIRHLGWHSLNLPRLARQTGARVVMSFHDFYVLSPSLKLLDDKNVFGGKDFSAKASDLPIEIWPRQSLPTLTDDWIAYWRERMAKALAHCDAFVTTSLSAKDRIADAFPNIPTAHFHVIPHGRDFPEFQNLREKPERTAPLKILVPGNINEAKGLDLIASLIELDEAQELEFHILGNVRTGALTEAQRARLHFHGSYNRADFSEKVQKITPHLGAVLSVWDETYCHTLTEMWSVGLPVVVLDFPNVRNRVSKSGAGWIFENLEPRAVWARLIELRSDSDDLNAKGNAALKWQEERGLAQSCRQMATRYLDVYQNRTITAPNAKIGVIGRQIAQEPQHDTLGADRILERTRNNYGRPMTYLWSDPAALIAQIRLGFVSGAILSARAVSSSLADNFLEIAAQTDTPFILDVDKYSLEKSANSDKKIKLSESVPNFERLIATASAVTVPNKEIRDLILPHNKNVLILQEAIEERLWIGARRSLALPATRIVYLAISANREELEHGLRILEAARKKLPGLDASVIVANRDMTWPEWVDEIPVPTDCNTYAAYASWLKSTTPPANLAIVPCGGTALNALEADRMILECGALGLPVFGSDIAPVRAAKQACPDGATVVEVDDPDFWGMRLVAALKGPDTLFAQGSALQSWVFAERTIATNQPDFDAMTAPFFRARSLDTKLKD